MAKKAKNIKQAQEIVYAPVQNQLITDTIEKNYMPYVMSVIVSRAIPEIDGLKPSHRKLLYTMYKMGLLTGPRTKSANVVGQTMKLNPHGDMAIYETMFVLQEVTSPFSTPSLTQRVALVSSIRRICASPLRVIPRSSLTHSVRSYSEVLTRTPWT